MFGEGRVVFGEEGVEAVGLISNLVRPLFCTRAKVNVLDAED